MVKSTSLFALTCKGECSEGDMGTVSPHTSKILGLGKVRCHNSSIPKDRKVRKAPLPHGRQIGSTVEGSEHVFGSLYFSISEFQFLHWAALACLKITN